MQVSKTILFEGAHRVGKGTAVGSICSETGYLHTMIDRGFASNYAFAVLYKRRDIDLDRAIHDFFANPTACVVMFMLGADDLEADCQADAAEKEKWVGLTKDYANRQLEFLIDSALSRAVDLGYGSRLLRLTARESDIVKQTTDILTWLETIGEHV